MLHQIQLNLQDRAALSAAISFWEKKEIKDKMKECLSYGDMSGIGEANKKWRQFIQAEIEEWNRHILPSHLEVELIHMVREIGEKIFSWCKYIKNENKSQYGKEENVMNYMDQIYWTPFGTVDEVKIFKSLWLKNSNLDVAKMYNLACTYALEGNINDLWHKLPKDIQDNCYTDINERFDRHILAYWKYCKDDNLPNLILHFKQHTMEEDLEEFNILYDLNLSVTENMLRLSVHQGYHISMEYFWNKLTDEERNRNILECARLALMCYKYYDDREDFFYEDPRVEDHEETQQDQDGEDSDSGDEDSEEISEDQDEFSSEDSESGDEDSEDNQQNQNEFSSDDSESGDEDSEDSQQDQDGEDLEWIMSVHKDPMMGEYKQEKYIEMCIFFINQMSENHKKKFFRQKVEWYESHPYSYDNIDVRCEILIMLLSGWLWQKMFILVLEDILKYQDNNRGTLVLKILTVITNKMVKDNKLGYSIETSKYRSLFRETWLTVPGTIKKKLMRNIEEDNFMHHLIDLYDLHSLKLIFNDPGIAADRDSYIYAGYHSYSMWILEDQFEKLDQLIEIMFKSEEQKKIFKQKMDFSYDYIRLNRFNLADKLLDWQSNTLEERQFIKSNSDHMQFCQRLINEKEFNQIDKFLNWRFETEEERKKCKDYFENDVFAMEEIYKIWIWNRKSEAERISFKFLCWLFGSHEEIAHFRTEKLVNAVIDESTIDRLFELSSIKKVRAFLKWCLLPYNEVERITQLLSQSDRRPVWMRN